RQRCAKPSKPHPDPGPDPVEPQRPKADNPDAQKRSSLFVRETIRDRVGEFFRRQRQLGVAAVNEVTREGGVVAQIFLARPAVLADAARAMQPGNPDPVARAKSRYAVAHALNPTHDLVPGDY